MKNLLYAVVKFPLENVIGVVCSKWLSADEKQCFYPASKADLFNMILILKREKDAMPGWETHPVVILGKYETYAEAKKNESKAEGTSNLSEEEEEGLGKRKRLKNPRYDTSDSSDCSPSPPMKKTHKTPTHPSLFSFSNSPSSTLKENTQPQTHQQTTYSPSTCRPNNSYYTDDMNTATCSVSSTPPPHCIVPATPPSSHNLLQQFQTPPHSSAVVPTAPTPQKCLESSKDSQVMDKLNHLISMVSALNERIEQLSERVDQLAELPHIAATGKTADKPKELLSLLPIKSVEEFDHFESKLIEEETFKKLFVKLMSTLGRRDPNALTINILRCFINDTTAQLFSLTGKKMGNFPAKRKFGDTRVCNSIFDAVRRRFKETSNDVIRGTIKGWLQQATPRIQKREKRRPEEETQYTL